MAGGGVFSTTDPPHTVPLLPEELNIEVDAATDWDTYIGCISAKTPGIFAPLMQESHVLNTRRIRREAESSLDGRQGPAYSELHLPFDAICQTTI